jgi:hypothetical protein
MKGLAAQIETQGPPNESLHPLPDLKGLPLPTVFLRTRTGTALPLRVLHKDPK